MVNKTETVTIYNKLHGLSKGKDKKIELNLIYMMIR